MALFIVATTTQINHQYLIEATDLTEACQLAEVAVVSTALVEWSQSGGESVYSVTSIEPVDAQAQHDAGPNAGTPLQHFIN